MKKFLISVLAINLFIGGSLICEASLPRPESPTKKTRSNNKERKIRRYSAGVVENQDVEDVRTLFRFSENLNKMPKSRAADI